MTVLIGQYTSDPIERHFGKYRQSAGSNYYLSAAEVFYAQRIQWTKTATKFCPEQLDSSQSCHACSICDLQVDEDKIMVSLLTAAEEINDDDKPMCALLYIAGYLVNKFPTIAKITAMHDEDNDVRYTEFLAQLDRGGLSYPSANVVTFVVRCFSLYSNLSTDEKSCRNMVCKIFEFVDQTYVCMIECNSAYRTLANIFSNNLCRHSAVTGDHSKAKIRKLSSK